MMAHLNFDLQYLRFSWFGGFKSMSVGSGQSSGCSETTFLADVHYSLECQVCPVFSEAANNFAAW